MRWVVALLVIAGCSRAPAAAQKLELVDAPASADVAPLIAAHAAQAQKDGKRLLVYLGATWCEPCRHFHEAAEAGRLDEQFGQLRLLVFDADRDSDALEKAGYSWELIPLFALPRPDGRSSGQQIEGSIKGADAVAQIAPRLQALVAR